jgi:hypothetical protein
MQHAGKRIAPTTKRPDLCRGRHLLTLWRVTGFEPVPGDYQQMLEGYPPPRTR